MRRAARPARAATLEEIDGRGLSAIPGLVDCHTHACFGGDRVNEFSLRAGGASYEELHAAGGGILSTVRATRAAGEEELVAITRAPPGVDARPRHDDVRGQVGLRPRPRHRARAAARRPRRRRHPDVARRAHGAARVRRRRRVHRLPARGGPRPTRPRSPRPPTSSSSAARSTPARRGATSRPAATRGSRCGSTATSSRSRARSRSRSSSARARSTTSRRPGRTGVAQLAASDVTGVLLPASALFLGRPMPPARALVDAGALVALATDFNPGSAFCDSLPLVLSLACTQMKLAPEEALVAATVNAAHVLGRADRIGRLAARLRGRRRAARRSRLAPRRLPPRRRRRPHRDRERSGRVPAHGIIPAMATQKQRTPAREGEAARLRPRLHRRGRRRAARRARGDAAQAAGPRRQGRRASEELEASKPAARRSRRGRERRSRRRGRKVLKRGAIFAPIFLATVMLLGGSKMTFTGAIVQTVLLHRRLHPVQLLHGSGRVAPAAEAPGPGRVALPR